MKTLIVGPSWVGDMIMAQSLFIYLHQKQYQIDVLAPQWTHPLLAYMPEVHHAIDMPIGHGQLGLRQRFILARELRKNDYELAIVLPNSFKSALIPFWASIPIRRGYRGEMRYGLINDMHILDKQQLTMTVQRFVALSAPAAAPLEPQQLQLDNIVKPKLQVSSQQKKSSREKFLTDMHAPVLILCPGAEYGPAKQWPAEHFAALAQYYLDKKWQICLLGSAKDKDIANRIEKLCQKKVLNLCGRTSLSQVMDVMSYGDLVVSNDSGLMHMAAALEKPVIGIYGSSDPQFTPPLGQNARVVSLNLSCSPCFKRQCPLGHLACLNQLRPEQVIEQATALV